MMAKKNGLSIIVGLLAGLAGVMLLVGFWHWIGGASASRQAGYGYTEYLLSCLSWPFVLAFAALSIALGWIVRTPLPLALGMMLPLPVAVVIEISLDPTSHNLFPFETLLYWLPAFVLAFLGGLAGKFIADRIGGG